MRLKKGVVLFGLVRKAMRPVLIAAERIYIKYGRKEGVTITETVGGVHSAGSEHPYGYAIDSRTWYFRKKTQLKVCEELRQELGSNYDVVLESNHIHIEYKIKEIGE